MFKRVRVCIPMYPLANQRCTLGAPAISFSGYSLVAGSLPEPGCSADNQHASGILRSLLATVLGAQAQTTKPPCSGAGGLNSGPQTHTTSTLTHWALSPELLKTIHILNIAE